MKLLLDTHTFLWFYLTDPYLSARALAHIVDDQHEKWISPVVYWEIAIKVSVGKMQFSVPYETLIDEALFENGFQILPIEPKHTAIIATLPFHHRDPFDRMLVAQALSEQATILSRDECFDSYGVPRIW